MAAVTLVSAPFMTFQSSILLGWDAGVLLYLILALRTACRLTPEGVRQQAEAMDEGASTVSTATVLAAMMALAGVVLELNAARESAWSAALAGCTVILSWSFIHVLFAHRYAHEQALRGGLIFPGEENPDFLECLYVSFTVGMTAQVSDVTTNSSQMRRLVLFHALVAFAFNAIVVAATVNLAAGLAF